MAGFVVDEDEVDEDEDDDNEVRFIHGIFFNFYKSLIYFPKIHHANLVGV